jgi:hypothetical protein
MNINMSRQRSGYLEKIAVNLLTGAAVLVLGIG